jgi:hypothetical protein
MYLPLLLFWVLSPDALAFPAAHLSLDGYSAGVNVRASEASRELADSARNAAARLAERLQGPGYWLTAHTVDVRFENPRQEMNTFTNAVMIDIAAPVAERAGITGLLGRARAFLANQIEADGLVRYHGRPDAPTVGKLGCAITPDADDTALVWRIAPDAHRELLSKALAKLDQFRAADGLYKTWLAPQDRYECIDPGRDPNPTDIGIQMHVLMLLAQVDRPAALALCEALSKQSSGDSVWVYYRIAPLVPLLRLADVHKAGCPLQLPQSRLQSDVPGQTVWLEVVQLLGRIERAQATSADYSKAADLLQRLAADEFSLVKAAPPLLYHNDLTARVRRFYWSEDVGYALWLRLHFERARALPGPREPAPT